MILPRISLVMPSYQQGAYLEATIQSVLESPYPNLEWLVFDGGSTDESVAILRHYESHFAYWTSEPDAGQAAVLKRGFARATGAILGWLNSDDLLEPDTLQTVGAYFAAHPGCDFVCGDGVLVNADNTHQEFYVRGGAYTFAQLLHYCDDIYLPQPGVFFSRCAYERVGGIDETLRYTMDLDLWLRLRQHFVLDSIPRVLTRMRLHADAKTQRSRFPALAEAERVTRRYWGEVGTRERAQIAWSWRALYARAYCKQGLTTVLAGDTRGGWSALRQMLIQNPIVLASPDAHKLLMRLVLPRSLRQRFLRVP